VQAGDANGDGSIRASELLITRDGIALALPLLAKLPYVCTVLLAAAGMAIALAASGSHLFTLGASLAEDVYRVLDRQPALPRIAAAWAVIAFTALTTAVFLVLADVDPLRGALTAFAFAGATFFPALLLGVWWQRCTALGALAAMGTGFIVTMLEVVFGSLFGSTQAGISTAIASLLGIILGLAAGVAASLYGPRATEAERTYCADMRNLGGEAIYDRAQQRAVAVAASASGK
jgi:cation/acetate symporter